MYLLINSFCEYSKYFEISLRSEKSIKGKEIFVLDFVPKNEISEKQKKRFCRIIDSLCRVKNYNFIPKKDYCFGIEITPVECLQDDDGHPFPDFDTTKIVNRKEIETTRLKETEVFVGFFKKRFFRKNFHDQTREYVEFENLENQTVYFEYAKLVKYDFQINSKYEIRCNGLKEVNKFSTMFFEIKCLD